MGTVCASQQAVVGGWCSWIVQYREYRLGEESCPG